MSLGPRIVFMRFLDEESPKLEPWMSHSTRVVGERAMPLAEPTGAPESSRAVWQLVSANNRQLARGVGVHETFDAARLNAQRVVDLGAALSMEFVSEASRGVYGWYATHEGEPVMTCARWYLTDRDRRHSSALAARSIIIAVLLAGARLTDPTLMGGRRAAES